VNELIDNLRDGIRRMREAGVAPRVLQMNQKTRDALGVEVDTLGLRVSIHPTAPRDMVYIVQKESVYNYNDKVYDNPLEAELAIDKAFGCDVFGVDWLDVTTMDDAAIGREVFIADLSGIYCEIGRTE
jgi:hypothetical protein